MGSQKPFSEKRQGLDEEERQDSTANVNIN
jgi:hypothetical protein